MTSETSEQNAYGSEIKSCAARRRTLARRCGGNSSAGFTAGVFLRFEYHHASAATARAASVIHSQSKLGPRGRGSRISRMSCAAAELLPPAGKTSALELVLSFRAIQV